MIEKIKEKQDRSKTYFTQEAEKQANILDKYSSLTLREVDFLLAEIDRLTVENNQLKRITTGVDLVKSVNHWRERAKKTEAELRLMLNSIEEDRFVQEVKHFK